MYALEQNGPIIANRMINAVASHKTIGAFNVVACSYAGTDRVFAHRTLKAATRRLSSVVDSGRGKLHRPGEFAAAIVTPEGHVINWNEARSAI